MEAELTYLQNGIKIFDFRHYKEDAKMGSPYNTLFQISVISNYFSGRSRWECDIKQLKALCEELHQMYDFKLNSTVLCDVCYGSKIAFSMDKTGHLILNGTIYSSDLEHSLTFEFKADQTAILPFIKKLEMMIKSSE